MPLSRNGWGHFFISFSSPESGTKVHKSITNNEVQMNIQALTCIDQTTGTKFYIVVKDGRVIDRLTNPVHPDDLKAGGFYADVTNTTDFRTVADFLNSNNLKIEKEST